LNVSEASESLCGITDVDIEEKFASLVGEPLIFAGLIASIDPERAGVKEAIATARSAGIRTVMITGDYLETAIAIGRNIGLMELGADQRGRAVDCEELRPHGHYLRDNDIDELTMQTVIFARARPADKLEIVKSLQRQGFVCAMTGGIIMRSHQLSSALLCYL
jgi:Ca2+-transporting ATPase